MPKTGTSKKPKSGRASTLDAFETRLRRRPGYREEQAKTQTIELLAARMIDYRGSRGISQQVLARKAGISRKLVNEIEGLVNTNPRLKTIEALAFAMGLPVARVLG